MNIVRRQQRRPILARAVWMTVATNMILLLILKKPAVVSCFQSSVVIKRCSSHTYLHFASRRRRQIPSLLLRCSSSPLNSSSSSEQQQTRNLESSSSSSCLLLLNGILNRAERTLSHKSTSAAANSTGTGDDDDDDIVDVVQGDDGNSEPTKGQLNVEETVGDIFSELRRNMVSPTSQSTSTAASATVTDTTTTPRNGKDAVAVGLLFSAVANRAEHTLLSSNQDTPLSRDQSASRLVQPPAVTSSVISSNSTTYSSSTATIVPTAAADDDDDGASNNDSTTTTTTKTTARHEYCNNPTISTLALAHSLWSHVLQRLPDKIGDTITAIDATAGNGNDSVVLARLLFPSSSSSSSVLLRPGNGTLSPDDDDEAQAIIVSSNAQLLAVDIQELACQNTTEKLAALLPANILRDNVRVLHTSHAPLPLPSDTSSVALVVYNLGYLPRGCADNQKGNEDRTTTTTTETTIASLADAAIVLRVGGMISVMTYPRTNKEEDFAVRAFLEGLALFSSVNVSWESYVGDLDCAAPLRDRLAVTLRHVLDEGWGGRKQKWRVHEHKKLGWIEAPILLTATRIN